jgi:hypothetical protein
MNKKYFVTFLSPGTLFNESTTKEIHSYDIKLAKEMASSIVERHGSQPYAFYFTTQEMQGYGWDSKPVTTHTSSKYYIRGSTESLRVIENRNDPRDQILISNMKCNQWTHVVRVDGQSFPFKSGDTFV